MPAGEQCSGEIHTRLIPPQRLIYCGALAAAAVGNPAMWRRRSTTIEAGRASPRFDGSNRTVSRITVGSSWQGLPRSVSLTNGFRERCCDGDLARPIRNHSTLICSTVSPIASAIASTVMPLAFSALAIALAFASSPLLPALDLAAAIGGLDHAGLKAQIVQMTLVGEALLA